MCRNLSKRNNSKAIKFPYAEMLSIILIIIIKKVETTLKYLTIKEWGRNSKSKNESANSTFQKKCKLVAVSYQFCLANWLMLSKMRVNTISCFIGESDYSPSGCLTLGNNLVI